MTNGLRRPGFLLPSKLTLAAVGLILLLAGPTAMATDGVIEINQAKVLAYGGFPFTITQPGTFRLTSNLVLPDSNTIAIRVDVCDV